MFKVLLTPVVKYAPEIWALIKRFLACTKLRDIEMQIHYRTHNKANITNIIKINRLGVGETKHNTIYKINRLG